MCVVPGQGVRHIKNSSFHSDAKSLAGFAAV